MCLVIGTTLVAAAAIPIIFLRASSYPPLALKIASLFSLGLIAGLAARILLSGQSFWVMSMVTLLGLFGALLLLKPLTLGFIGVLPIYTPFIDWNGIAQLGIVFLAAWIPLRIGKRTQPNRKPKIANSTHELQKTEHLPSRVKMSNRKNKAKPKSSPDVKLHSQSQGKSSSSPNLQSLSVIKAGWEKGWKPLRGNLERWRSRLSKALDKSGRWIGEFVSQSQRNAPQLPRRLPLKSSAYHLKTKGHPRPRPVKIRLKGEEEHRCPYCLEIVAENDPRGVKVCPMCGTYHHADCWAVTGVCQIPHLHT